MTTTTVTYDDGSQLRIKHPPVCDVGSMLVAHLDAGGHKLSVPVRLGDDGKPIKFFTVPRLPEAVAIVTESTDAGVPWRVVHYTRMPDPTDA